MTLPLPVPLALVANEIHEASDVALHEHPPTAVTLTGCVPPSAFSDCSPGLMLNRHDEAVCSTRARLSLTTTSPTRAVATGFSATRNVISPLPWPLAGVSPVIHGACEDAVQAHSGWVVTSTLLVPPSPSTAPAGESDTAHLTGVGPVLIAELDLHPAATATVRMTQTNEQQRRRHMGGGAR